LDWENIIKKEGLQILKSGIQSILDHSSKSEKYEDYTLKRFNEIIQNPSELYDVILIVLLPAPSIKMHINADFVFTFNDLPESINHKWSDVWKIIRRNLISLDTPVGKKRKLKSYTYPTQQVAPDIIYESAISKQLIIKYDRVLN